MASRFPAPVPIAERTARGRPSEMPLEPVDEIAVAVEDFGEQLALAQRHILALSQKLGNLQAAIQAERERRTVSRLLTTNEVAALLRMSPDSVRELKQRGKLRAVQVGEQSPRFRESDVAEFIAARSR
jgi:excisionase family DNA binding protein